MNSKGFTLTELLAIVVIIVLVSLVAIPSMTKQIKKEEEQMQSILNNKIENATKLYAVKYHASDLIKGNSISISLDDLEKDGLINLQNKCGGPTEAGRKNNKIIVDVDADPAYNYEAIISLPNCYKP